MSQTNCSFINCAAFLDVEAAQGIDEVHGSCVRGVVSSINTYQMEYDPYSRSGRLPQCFVREFGDLIDEHVILQDPNHNKIEVRVLKKCSEMSFEQGWTTVRDFYHLWFGGWLSFKYVCPKLLTISLMTRWGTEVVYPFHDPPFKQLLAIGGVDPKICSATLPRISSNPFVFPMSFRRSYFKRLTSYDVESGILVLPWYGFGEFAFAFTFSKLVLVDHTGCRYPCSIQFSVDDDDELACKVFVSPLVFHIKIRYIFGMEITYPNRTPPYRLMLGKGFQESSSTGPIPFFVLPSVFSHMLEKTLTVSDVETGYLTLFWKGFCEAALPSEETRLTFIDWVGNTWDQCDYKFQDATHATCKISGQWHDICKVHRLSKGMIIKLGVTGAANNRIVYFKLSPYLGVRTTLYAPTTSNTYKRIYQSQHFYML
ncbi:unnamed protein product [Trifolium pratense]|uniref:Uncharacterized protein n=1 Tax=Trifolium pratense TaxID=57577 RepID=A0ACB0JDU7_TRIPR|nr:unnamed protein product [Trifolium pratense]